MSEEFKPCLDCSACSVGKTSRCDKLQITDDIRKLFSRTEIKNKVHEQICFNCAIALHEQRLKHKECDHIRGHLFTNFEKEKSDPFFSRERNLKKSEQSTDNSKHKLMSKRYSKIHGYAYSTHTHCGVRLTENIRTIHYYQKDNSMNDLCKRCFN